MVNDPFHIVIEWIGEACGPVVVSCLSVAVCLLIGWASARGGCKTNTTCKSDNSHTCAGHLYDGLQWAGCVGTCKDRMKDNFAARRVTTPYLSSEHTVTDKTTCGSGYIRTPSNTTFVNVRTVLVAIFESVQFLRRSARPTGTGPSNTHVLMSVHCS